MSVLLKIIDLMASSIAAVPLFCYIIIKSAFSKKSTQVPEVRKMLILDMSYTLEIVRKRQLQAAMTSRDLGGYFSHVWNVHPCSTIIEPEKEQDRYGKFSSTSMTSKLTFVEGKIGRFKTLKNFPALNFILAQIDIFIYLNSLITKEKITIIRAGDPYYLGPFGLSLSWMNKIPCTFRIAQSYDTFYEMTGGLAFPRLFRKRWVEKIIERFTLRRADLVAGGNQHGLNFALNNGARKEYSTVFRVGNLIHAAHFQPPEERPGAEDKLQGLGLVGKNFSITICRLEPVKHVDDVIRGLAEVRKLGFDFYALLVGDGTMKEELIDLAELLGMTDYVVFAGNRSQEWIASVLPDASVVISPHMGRALTEASLSGAPVVAYDVEWQGEIIKTGETGELVEYRNWKTMAEAVVKLISDQIYAENIGANARENTLAMMSPEKLNEHEKNEYDKLFSRYYLGDSYGSNQIPAMKRLLVVDSHYSLETIRECKFEESIVCRDLNGFFDRVWSVHPFASLVTSDKWTNKFGKPEYYSLTPIHTFIEGKMGRFSLLSWFPALNFLISQFNIICLLVRLIRKERISVIRADEPQYNGLLGWVLSRLCGIPFLLRVGNNHDQDYEATGRISMQRLFKTRRIEKIIERFVLSRADYVAGANQDNLNFAISSGARPEVSTIFRYGNLIVKQHFDQPVDRSDGRPLLNELGVDPKRFILTIARLESLKQLEDVIRVLTEIRRRSYDFKAIIAGDGRLRDTLVELASQLGVKDQVILCGNRDQEWLARVIPLAAVVVSPFMGRALTECALGAAPIVAYDVDWQSELIQSGVTGELVPYLDWEKMADSVEHFLLNPEYAFSMGEAVRKRALEMMDPAILDKHERDTYQKIIHAADPPPVE